MSTSTDSRAQDESVLLTLQQKMTVIRDQFPEWYAHYEDSDPITTDRQTLQELLDTAPDDFSQGLIVGITLFRTQLAILTGRDF